MGLTPPAALDQSTLWTNQVICFHLVFTGSNQTGLNWSRQIIATTTSPQKVYFICKRNPNWWNIIPFQGSVWPFLGNTLSKRDAWWRVTRAHRHPSCLIWPRAKNCHAIWHCGKLRVCCNCITFGDNRRLCATLGWWQQNNVNKNGRTFHSQSMCNTSSTQGLWTASISVQTRKIFVNLSLAGGNSSLASLATRRTTCGRLRPRYGISPSTSS